MAAASRSFASAAWGSWGNRVAKPLIGLDGVAPLGEPLVGLPRLQERGGLPARCIEEDARPSGTRGGPRGTDPGGRRSRRATTGPVPPDRLPCARRSPSGRRPGPLPAWPARAGRVPGEVELGGRRIARGSSFLSASASSSASFHRFSPSRHWTCRPRTRAAKPSGSSGPAGSFRSWEKSDSAGSRSPCRKAASPRKNRASRSLGPEGYSAIEAIQRRRAGRPVSELELRPSEPVEGQGHEPA